jgi:hypothetical protein
MSQADFEKLMKMFECEKKSQLQRYARELVLSSDAFFHLIVACETHGQPFLHQIHYRDHVPEHLHPSEAEWKALADNGLGLLKSEAAKTVSKMTQMFVERRYLVGHMFVTPDRSKWHFFCFDQRDLEKGKPNHWKEGSHVHFVNWLWPGQDAQAVWTNFIEGDYRPGNSLHLRFSGL